MNAPGLYRYLTAVIFLFVTVGVARAVPATPPSNDTFANALLITGDSATGSNEAATRQAGEPRTVQGVGNLRSTLGGHSVWWKWTAPYNAQYTIRTGDAEALFPSSTFDTQLGVYTGSSVSNLVEVASNEDHADFTGGLSQLSFRAKAGTTYFILVDGKQGELGTIYLYISRTRFSLTVDITPLDSATVTIDPPAPAGGYLPGTSVTLALDTTNTFYGWTGINTRSNPVTIIIQSNTVLTAHFASDGLLFWQHTNGPVAAWYMNGSAVLSAYFLGNASNAVLRAVADMDEDGDKDLLLQDLGGRINLWELQGEAVVRASEVAPVNPAWRLAGVGAFNSDGLHDFVFQHNDGRVVIWLMDGTRATNALLLATTQPGWGIKAVHDFNSDNWSDIFFQHTDGRIVLWLMDGTLITTAVRLPSPSSGWSLAAVKDFNGDDSVDLLFESSGRQLAIWLMNGVSRSGGTLLRSGRPFRPGWHVVGAQ